MEFVQASITKIAIAIITRRRPTALMRLLASVDHLIVPPNCAIEVVVVENDTAHTAELPRSAFPLRHIFEPMQGIPIARNRALDECCHTADWILFLDDDETVDPLLVTKLLALHETTHAPIVTGPALPRFEPGAPSWAARSGAYMPVRHAHGARVPYAFTNNVLFSATLVRGENAPRFCKNMLYTGGSDREFFARLAMLGHHIVWADDALAFEWYPASRASYRWLFQRSYRLGTVAPATEAMQTEGRGLSIRARCKLLWRATRFALRAVFRCTRRISDPASAIALAAWDMGRCAGLFAAVCGMTYEEYRSR